MSKLHLLQYNNLTNENRNVTIKKLQTLNYIRTSGDWIFVEQLAIQMTKFNNMENHLD